MPEPLPMAVRVLRAGAVSAEDEAKYHDQRAAYYDNPIVKRHHRRESAALRRLASQCREAIRRLSEGEGKP